MSLATALGRFFLWVRIMDSEQGVPLALDISSINAYVEQYDLPVERYIFNDCIFTLDDMFLDEAHKKATQRATKT
ncbi:hypothetical protein [Acinetobacter baumannii]|uniref:hypothetical protein n=1 Tax=Acinetobacter baumannii TaxID=470 RepID=UPI001FD6D187|nr:hypothetical protein [Acinetobacter baumannii]